MSSPACTVMVVLLSVRRPSGCVRHQCGGRRRAFCVSCAEPLSLRWAPHPPVAHAWWHRVSDDCDSVTADVTHSDGTDTGARLTVSSHADVCRSTRLPTPKSEATCVAACIPMSQLLRQQVTLLPPPVHGGASGRNPTPNPHPNPNPNPNLKLTTMRSAARAGRSRRPAAWRA